MNRENAPQRKVVAVSANGTRILDCGHVRGRPPREEIVHNAKGEPIRYVGDMTCDACLQDAENMLTDYNLKRGEGL
jgi:hypothetical protein